MPTTPPGAAANRCSSAANSLLIHDRHRHLEAGDAFLGPLLAQSGGADDEDARREAARAQFRSREHRLHRLSKAHVVCNEHARAEAVQQGERRFELERHQIDPCGNSRAKRP